MLKYLGIKIMFIFAPSHYAIVDGVSRTTGSVWYRYMDAPDTRYLLNLEGYNDWMIVTNGDETNA